MAPKIDRRNIHTYNIKSGEPIFLDVQVSGEPPADIVWSQSDKSIQQSSSRSIENKPYNTKYINGNPDRKDTGLYKIVATNKYGQDEVEFQLNVISMFDRFVMFF